MTVYFFGRARDIDSGAAAELKGPAGFQVSCSYDDKKKTVKLLTDGKLFSMEYSVSGKPAEVEVFDVDGDRDPDVVLTFSDGTKKLVEGINTDLACLQAADSYTFDINDLPVLSFAAKDARFANQAKWMISRIFQSASSRYFELESHRVDEPKGVTSSRKMHPSLACISTGEYPKRSAARIKYMQDTGIKSLEINSWQAFGKMAEAFQKNRMPELVKSGKKDVTILYPASGSHVAPLEAAFYFLRNTPELESVNLIYSEISEKAPADLLKNLQFLEREGLVLSLSQKAQAYGESGGVYHVFSMKVDTPHGQKTINLTLALNTCTESVCGTAYYRPEYFDAADIVLIHDMGSETSPQESGEVYPEMAQAIRMIFNSAWKQGGGRKTMWLEDGASMDSYLYRRGWTREFMPDYASVKDLPYGCRYDDTNPAARERGKNHMGVPMFTGAMIDIEPALLKGLNEVQFESLMQTITDMSAGEDSGTTEGAIAVSALRWAGEGDSRAVKWLEKNKKFVEAADHWESVAQIMRKNGGSGAEWRFRRAALSRLEGSLSEAFFKDPGALSFLENTVAMALADQNKFDDLFNWMEDAPLFGEAYRSEHLLLSIMTIKLNLLSIFFTITQKMGKSSYDKFIRCIKPKFEKFVEKGGLNHVDIPYFQNGRRPGDLEGLKAIQLVRYSSEPYSVALYSTGKDVYSPYILEQVIKLSHYGRLLFRTDERRFFFDSPQEKKTYEKLGELRRQLEWAGQYIAITTNGRKGMTLSQAPDLF